MRSDRCSNGLVASARVAAMPVEVRYIVFQLGETEALLRHGLAKLGRACPPGRLVCLAARRSHFEFLYNSGQTAALSPAELFAAVLWHCQKRRIPIAQQFQKRFEIDDRRLILVSGDVARGRAATDALGGLDPSPRCPLCAESPDGCVLARTDAGAAAPALAAKGD
jgi:hypothetical protein